MRLLLAIGVAAAFVSALLQLRQNISNRYGVFAILVGVIAGVICYKLAGITPW